MIQDFERYTEDSDGVSNARVLVEAFDRHYYPYSDDMDSNHRALEVAFSEQTLAKTWLFTLYLGLGVESMESILWLTETMFLNNPDIPL